MKHAFRVLALACLCAPMWGQVPIRVADATAQTMVGTSCAGLRGLTLSVDDAAPPYDLLCAGATPTWKVKGSVGGGVSDGDKGDVTVSGTGSTWTVDKLVTFAGTPPGTCTAGTVGVDTTYWYLYQCPATNQWQKNAKLLTGTGAPASGSCDNANEAGNIYVNLTATTFSTSMYLCGASGAGPTYAWTQVEVGGDSLPTQTGNANRFLTTDGTAASWAEILSGSNAGAGISITGSGASLLISRTADTLTMSTGTSVPGSCTSTSQFFHDTDDDLWYGCNGSTYGAFSDPYATYVIGAGTVTGIVSTTANNVVATINIAAGTLGHNDSIQCESMARRSGVANNSAVAWGFGGANLTAGTMGSTDTWHHSMFRMYGSASGAQQLWQRVLRSTNATVYADGTSSINLATTATTLTLQAWFAAGPGADTMSISYTCFVIPGR